jgi:hypothetical protein
MGRFNIGNYFLVFILIDLLVRQMESPVHLPAFDWFRGGCFLEETF